MGLRRRGLTMVYWQRVAAKKYVSEEAIGRLTVYAKEDLYDALEEALGFCEGYSDIFLDQILDATDELRDDLEFTTPKDPLGPNDPPLHAKHAWKVSASQQKSGQVKVSVTNTKHYMQFLEAYGGKHDSDGNEGGPAAGWISDIFEKYALNVRSIQ